MSNNIQSTGFQNLGSVDTASRAGGAAAKGTSASPQSGSDAISRNRNSNQSVNGSSSIQQMVDGQSANPSAQPHGSGTPLSSAEYNAATSRATNGKTFGEAAQSAYGQLRKVNPAIYDQAHYDTTNADNLFNDKNSALFKQSPDMQANVRLHQSDGWIRTMPVNGNAGEAKGVVSMDAEPSADLVKQLDAFAAKHKNLVSEYKYPNSLEKWQGSRDPITMYVNDPEKFKQSGALDELKTIMNGHQRRFSPEMMQKFKDKNMDVPDPASKLLGTQEGNGIAIADAVTPERTAELQARAREISPDLGNDVDQYVRRYNGLSAGKYDAVNKTVNSIRDNSRLAPDGAPAAAQTQIRGRAPREIEAPARNAAPEAFEAGKSPEFIASHARDAGASSEDASALQRAATIAAGENVADVPESQIPAAAARGASPKELAEAARTAGADGEEIAGTRAAAEAAHQSIITGGDAEAAGVAAAAADARGAAGRLAMRAAGTAGKAAGAAGLALSAYEIGKLLYYNAVGDRNSVWKMMLASHENRMNGIGG